VTVFQNYPFRARTLYATAAELTAANPVLLEGEWGTEKVTGKRKIGPGAWNELPYWDAGGSGGSGPPAFNWCTPANALNSQDTDVIYIVFDPGSEFSGDWYYKSAVDGSFQPQQLPSAVQPENTYPTLGDFPAEGVQGLVYLEETNNTNYYAAFVGGVFSSYEIVPSQSGTEVYFYSSLDALNSRDPVDFDGQFYRVLIEEGERFVLYAAFQGQWTPAAVVQLILPNGSGVLEGSYDDGNNGGGVSLLCAADFEFNWQGGRARVFDRNDETGAPLPLILDSPITLPAGGITFDDDTTLTTAPVLGDAGGLDVGTTAGTVAAGDDARFHASVDLAASITDVLSLTGQTIGAVDPGVDPGVDRLLFWDDSESKLTQLSLGTNLSITGTTLNAAGGDVPPSAQLLLHTIMR
jgi:hypothetical protein